MNDCAGIMGTTLRNLICSPGCRALFPVCAILIAGCQTTGHLKPVSETRVRSDWAETADTDHSHPGQVRSQQELKDAGDVAADVAIQLVSRSTTEDVVEPGERTPEVTPVSLKQVVVSVHRHFPLVFAAWQQRRVADGEQLSAWGEFDTKLKADSENQPLGFYETYRNSAGILQPLYDGGQVFGGYRNGGGSFEPWYRERETNHGGELKGGVRIPLIRDRQIDARRAELWRRTYDQQLADPFVRSTLIEFSAQAGRAFWKWVTAGQKYRLGQQWLELARSRADQIQMRVDTGDLDPPEQTDNLRAIAKREAKLANSLRMVEQAAAKLSVFLRDDNGRPYIPSLEELPTFPALRRIDSDSLAVDVGQAQANNPELQALRLQLRKLQVDYSEACNLTRARLDAQLTGSQDVGEPTSSKRDKSELELEAGLYFDYPLQRRKGRGKAFAVQAKMAQVRAKRQLVGDKVKASVQAAYAGLIRSREEAAKASEAATLADQMAGIERRKFELGESDLLKVALREQYALEAAEEVITASLNHFTAFTEYSAALSIQHPSLHVLSADDSIQDTVP